MQAAGDLVHVHREPRHLAELGRRHPLLTHPGDSIRPGGGPIHHPPSAGGCPGSAHPGPRNPARETISCRPAATSPRSSLVSPALLPRPPKSPHIQRENGREPWSDPGVRAPTRLGGGGGSLQRTRLATNLGKCPQAVEPTACCVRTNDRSGVHRDGWIPDPDRPQRLPGGPTYQVDRAPWHRAMRAVDRGVRTRRTFRLFRKIPEYSGSNFGLTAARRSLCGPTLRPSGCGRSCPRTRTGAVSRC